MAGNAVSVNYLPGRVFAVLVVEHGLIFALGLLTLAFPDSFGPGIAIVAFATAGLVISSIAFACRWRARSWARVASALGLVVAAGVSGLCAKVLWDLAEPCHPGASECEGSLGLEGFILSLSLVCGAYLLFLGLLARHWFRSLRRRT